MFANLKQFFFWKGQQSRPIFITEWLKMYKEKQVYST